MAKTDTKKTADKANATMTDMSERAKAASEKSVALMGEAGEFGRGNLEAMVEAGKIAVKGVQEIGRDNLAMIKNNIEDASATYKQMASVKSSTELMQLQSEMVRKNLDAMVAQASQNTEKMVKLAGDMFQPLSNRIALAGEKAKQAA